MSERTHVNTKHVANIQMAPFSSANVIKIPSERKISPPIRSHVIRIKQETCL